jgi:hypothetical protein
VNDDDDDDDDEIVIIKNRRRQDIHVLNGIRTHGLGVQAIKAYASDSAATATGLTL